MRYLLRTKRFTILSHLKWMDGIDIFPDVGGIVSLGFITIMWFERKNEKTS